MAPYTKQATCGVLCRTARSCALKLSCSSGSSAAEERNRQAINLVSAPDIFFTEQADWGALWTRCCSSNCARLFLGLFFGRRRRLPFPGACTSSLLRGHKDTPTSSHTVMPLPCSTRHADMRAVLSPPTQRSTHTAMLTHTHTHTTITDTMCASPRRWASKITHYCTC